ncbi:SLAM family member 8-like [Spea bombifrons]|uniref:SLAM family member 8-like n=1 Tax=Spea bombifrons TaxID=233779 RepID=UPI00234B7E6F|nr:SLAM family member 8-like [Spea bombifrons]
MIRWLTPILLAQTAYVAEQTAQVHGVLGGSIRLSPALPDGFRTRDVFWKHLSRSDELVASFSRGFSETTYRSRFFGRVQLGSDFTLQIGGLEPGDSGMFSCHLVDTEGHMALFQFHLTVYEAVAPPLIQVFVLRGRAEATGCSVLLSCNTTAGSDVSYTWTANSGRGDPLNTTYTLYDGGRLLRTSLEPGDSDASYTCTASNAVSQGHEAVVPWHGCSGQWRGYYNKSPPWRGKQP